MSILNDYDKKKAGSKLAKSVKDEKDTAKGSENKEAEPKKPTEGPKKQEKDKLESKEDDKSLNKKNMGASGEDPDADDGDERKSISDGQGATDANGLKCLQDMLTKNSESQSDFNKSLDAKIDSLAKSIEGLPELIKACMAEGKNDETKSITSDEHPEEHHDEHQYEEAGDTVGVEKSKKAKSYLKKSDSGDTLAKSTPVEGAPVDEAAKIIETQDKKEPLKKSESIEDKLVKAIGLEGSFISNIYSKEVEPAKKDELFDTMNKLSGQEYDDIPEDRLDDYIKFAQKRF